jgi:cysteinyl-tRNA synthetase
MDIYFYNTLSRKKELFKPLNPPKVTIYCCGPTVYNVPHIGNYRSFLFGDLLSRVLKYFGYQVKNVMNLTDVEDKTIRNSQKAGVPLKEHTEKYIKLFFDALKELNFEDFKHYPRATEHIPDMLRLIERLEENGHIYQMNGSVYYRISSFKNYGKLARLDFDKLKENAQGRLDQDEYDKENARDFALWKGYTKEDGDVFWESKYGKGRPGWHIECSAMSMKYLGETLDIHTGGEDLIFPHHSNEIAQSEGATGKQFVRYWMHVAFLKVDNDKMAKSLGNFFSLDDIKKKGISPIALRYFYVSNYYRKQLNFTEEALKASENAIKKLNEFVFYLKNIDNKEGEDADGIIKETKEGFDKALSDDLNMPNAVAAIFNMLNKAYKLNLSKKGAENCLNFLKQADRVLGVMDFKEEEEGISKKQEELIKEREKARENKDWKRADEIRDELRSQGIELIDTDKGTIWRKKG